MGSQPPAWWTRARDEVVPLFRPGDFGLVVGPRTDAEDVLRAIGSSLGEQPRSVSEVGLAGTPASTPAELMERLAGGRLLYDVEALCWKPWLQTSPMAFLRVYTRRHGALAVWPWGTQGGRLVFSVEGRADYVRESLAGTALLRVAPARFPDQVPFTLERL